MQSRKRSAPPQVPRNALMRVFLLITATAIQSPEAHFEFIEPPILTVKLKSIAPLIKKRSSGTYLLDQRRRQGCYDMNTVVTNR